MKKNGHRKEKSRTSQHQRRITRRQIATAARHIAERFDPEKIILFGSYAYGKPTADSDVDLLVVMKERLPWPKQEAEIYKSFRPYPFAMDIVVETPSRLQQRVQRGDPFLKEISEQGRILYER